MFLALGKKLQIFSMRMEIFLHLCSILDLCVENFMLQGNFFTIKTVEFKFVPWKTFCRKLSCTFPGSMFLACLMRPGTCLYTDGYSNYTATHWALFSGLYFSWETKTGVEGLGTQLQRTLSKHFFVLKSRMSLWICSIISHLLPACAQTVYL